MRRLLFLPAVLLLAGLARAAEPIVDPVTAHLPAKVWFVVRIAPLDRLEEIGKLLQPYLVKFGGTRSLTEAALEDLPEEYRPLVDRTRPMYLAFREGGFCMLYHSVTKDDGEFVRGPNRTWVRLRQGMIHRGQRAALEAPRLTEPVALAAGDVSFMVPSGRLLAEFRPKADEALAKIDELENFQGYEIPRAVLPLLKVMGRVAIQTIFSLEDAHHTLTFHGREVRSQIWIRSMPRSPVRGFLAKAGEPSTNRLMGYLPDDALWHIDSCGTASWLDGELAALLDEAFGEGAGKDLLLIASPAFALADHLTGHAAGTISMPGLMALQSRGIHEIKEGAPIEEAIAKLDGKRVNALLARLEIPASIRLNLDAARHGETKLHRLAIESSVPQAAMFVTQMQTYFAVEGRHLFVVQSASSESDLRSLIDTVRRGEPREHRHLTAMSRFGEKRHEGLTVNLAAIRPAVAVAAFAVPEVTKLLNVIPERLDFSFALTVRDGHIHLEGVIPLFEILDIIVKVAEG